MYTTLFGFGTRFQTTWFSNGSHVRDFCSNLLDQFGNQDRVERAVFNQWLTQVTQFALPVDVAFLAKELLGRGFIVAEYYGKRGVRYELKRDHIAACTNDSSAMTYKEKADCSTEVAQAVRNPETLKTMLKALLDIYEPGAASAVMSRVGMAQVALGRIGIMRLKQPYPTLLYAMLSRRGFVRNFQEQIDSPGRLKLMREEITSFLQTGVIPWTRGDVSVSTNKEIAMATVEEFEAEGLKVSVKRGGDHNTKIHKHAGVMIHTLLKEAGFRRGVFNLQLNGSWENGHPVVAQKLFGKVLSSPGPNAFIGLKCGKDLERDTLTGYLSGAWSMKFEVVRAKLEAAMGRLNVVGWSSIRMKPESDTSAPATAPAIHRAEEVSLPKAATLHVSSGADSVSETAGSDALLHCLMRRLIGVADKNGIFTMEALVKEAKAQYPGVKVHGLATGKQSSLLARKWIRRVYEGEVLVMQVEASYLEERKLPVTFVQREKVPKTSWGSKTGKRTTVIPIDTTVPSAKKGADDAAVPSTENEQGSKAEKPEKAIEEVPSGGMQDALKTIRSLTERHAVLGMEIQSREAERAMAEAEIKRLTGSLSREALLEFILQKI